MKPVADLLHSLYDKGVTLWIENGVLHHAAPSGVLIAEDLRNIEIHYNDILKLYEQPSSASEDLVVPRLPCEPLTTTFQQQWYEALLKKYGLHYLFIGCAMRLVGPLDVEALRASIGSVIERHEALRTNIKVVDGAITQRIEPPCRFRGYQLEVLTLNGSLEDTEAQARRLGREFISDPPNWDTGPAFHARLLKLADNFHVLLVTIDHAVADGLSIGIVNKEVFVSYLALTQGNPCPLSKAPLQYSDYAAWQRRNRASWDIRHGGYWQERLAGAQRIHWPIDNGISDAKPFTAATLHVRIEAQLTHQLREFAKRQHTTLPRIMLAVFAVAVSQTCHARDLVIPFNAIGRNHYRLAEVVGYFPHVLYLRFQLPDDPSLLDALDCVQKELIAATEHSDFGRLVKAIPEFLVGAWFQWEPWATSFTEQAPIKNSASTTVQRNARTDTLKISRFAVDPVAQRDDVKLDRDVTVIFSENAQGIGGACFYRADLFKKETMEQFGRNLRRLAELYVENPTMRASVCPLETA